MFDDNRTKIKTRPIVKLYLTKSGQVLITYLWDAAYDNLMALLYISLTTSYAGADPGFLDWGFKLAEGGTICAVWPIFPEILQENEII